MTNLQSERKSSDGASYFGSEKWWKKVDWLGYVYAERFPWIWTTSHQWWYLREEAVGFWMWDTGLDWLLYLEGSSGTRWFFDYTTGDWVSL